MFRSLRRIADAAERSAEFGVLIHHQIALLLAAQDRTNTLLAAALRRLGDLPSRDDAIGIASAAAAMAGEASPTVLDRVVRRHLAEHPPTPPAASAPAPRASAGPPAPASTAYPRGSSATPPESPAAAPPDPLTSQLPLAVVVGTMIAHPPAAVESPPPPLPAADFSPPTTF